MNRADFGQGVQFETRGIGSGYTGTGTSGTSGTSGALSTPSSSLGQGYGSGSGYDMDFDGGATSQGQKILTNVGVVLVILIVIFSTWFVFFRKKYTLMNFLMLPFTKIIEFIQGIWATLTGEPISPGPTLPDLDDLALPPLHPFEAGGGLDISEGGKVVIPEGVHSTQTEVTKHVITDCPPCNNECNCPQQKECDHRPYELEIKYLKDMVRFVGSVAMRESAINSQFRELHPGFTVNSPRVRQLTHEYNYIKNQLRKNKNQWQYFKNYFSKLSGIPSTTTAVHHELML